MSFSNNNSPQNSRPLQHVAGDVLRHTFISDDCAYCVIKINDEQTGEELTLTGANLHLATEGQSIDAEGNWAQHKQFGRQFRVESYKVTMPVSRKGMIRYLSGGVIDGLGKIMAERIVDRFGGETYHILDTAAARLSEIRGISKTKAEGFGQQWKENSEDRELLTFLKGLGIGPGMCVNIMSQYGLNAVSVIKNNPYALISEIRGMGFILADRIASNMGLAKESPFRLQSGLEHTLNQAESNGHVCLPGQVLLQEAIAILGVSEELLQQALLMCEKNGLLLRFQRAGEQESYWYNRDNCERECSLADSLNLCMRRIRGNRIEAQLKLDNQQLNEEQHQAVVNALTHPLSIITGGPGVGKTTTICEVVKQAKLKGLRICLAAPTGRAAQRMAEASGCEASTIHRLLMIKKGDSKDESEEEDNFGADKKLKHDLIILDECSMMDLFLADRFFRSIDFMRSSVVVVGDPDQLPSVGAGNILNDLLNIPEVPISRLHRIYRQKDGSRIIDIAHSVNAGQNFSLANPAKGSHCDFYFIAQDDPQKLMRQITHMIQERIPKVFGIDANSVQILNPMNRGGFGCDAINRDLQESLNPLQFEQEMKLGDISFRPNDRVIQRKNNYDKKIFNGEMGLITKIKGLGKEQELHVSFDGRKTTYNRDELGELGLAYAITIHKSQGSEFPCVILPLLNSHYIMLQRNLLYTGITRARQLLILCGSTRAVQTAIGNYKATLRHTNLVPRLQQLL